MIDVHYASLTSQGVQHRVFYLDGYPSRYQPVFPFGDSHTLTREETSGCDDNEKVLESTINVKSCGPNVEKRKKKEKIVKKN